IVVREILLDDIALVSQAHDEVVDAVVGIDLHDVPEDGPAADFDHRLGPDGCLFTKPSAQTTGEDNELHKKYLRGGIRLLCFRRDRELRPSRLQSAGRKSACGRSSLPRL